MSGDVLTNMFPQLAALLLQILAGLLVAGLLTGGAVCWWQRRAARAAVCNRSPSPG